MSSSTEERRKITPRERAAAPIQISRIRQAGLSEVTRVEHGRLSTSLLRDLYLSTAGDLPMALVLLEVASRSFEAEYPPWVPVGRWPRPDRESGYFIQDAGLPPRLLACNVLSLSEVVGMPRETVRRKTIKLLELGWIDHAISGGYVVTKIGWDAIESMAHHRAIAALLTADRIRSIGQINELG